MTDQELQKKRLIAAAIDIGIGIAISLVFGCLGAALGGAAGFAASRSDGATGSAVAGYLPRIIGFVGAVIGAVYVLGRDVFAGGRSFGKQTQGLRVVTLNGAPITAVDSAKRNLIFGVGSLIGLLSATIQLIPCAGDAVACLLMPLQLLVGLATLVAVGIELYKITQDPQGIRIGDQFAGTRVTY